MQAASGVASRPQGKAAAALSSPRGLALPSSALGLPAALRFADWFPTDRLARFTGLAGLTWLTWLTFAIIL